MLSSVKEFLGETEKEKSVESAREEGGRRKEMRLSHDLSRTKSSEKAYSTMDAPLQKPKQEVGSSSVAMKTSFASIQ